MFLKLLTVFLLLNSSVIFSEEFPTQWTPIPGLKLYELLVYKKGEVLSSSVLPGVGERSDIHIIIIRAENNIYKCHEFYTSDGTENGCMIFKLKDNKGK